MDQRSNDASQDVGVWAVQGSSALDAVSALPGQSSSGSPDGLELGPTKVVSVVLRGRAHDVVTNATTVGELLSAMRIEPDWDDRVSPPPTTPIPRTSVVTYTAVDEHPETVLGPYSRRQYLVRVVNGKVVSRRLVWSQPVDAPPPAHQSTEGVASWYYVNDRLNAASPWLPFGTRVLVTNLATGATVTVVINDRGPFGGRLIDLSEYAFSRIAPLGQGVAEVRITW